MNKKFIQFMVAALLSLFIIASYAGSGMAGTPGPFGTNQFCQSADIKFGENVTVFSGNVGVNLPNSAYSGKLQVCRNAFSRPQHTSQGNLRFVRPFVYWTLEGSQVSNFLFGINYVYFRLNDVQLRRAYQAGSMAIYYWNPDKLDWIMLATSPVAGTDPIIVKAIAPNFGYFGLAVTR